MRLRDSIGLNLSPFLLRLVLGLTFVLAGAAKMLTEVDYTPEQTAILSQMGVKIHGQGGHGAPPAADESGTAQDRSDDSASDETTIDETEPASDASPEDIAKEPTAPVATASGEPVKMRMVYTLALWIHDAAEPGFDKDGNQLRPLWPQQLATNKWPIWIAYAAALTELIAGICMFAGFMTRIGAFSLVVVMGAAMWLTQIGPAFQSNTAFLGFLPNHAWYDVQSWQMLLWQFSLFGAAGAVVLLGAGAMSLDAIIFGGPTNRRHRHNEDDDD